MNMFIHTKRATSKSESLSTCANVPETVALSRMSEP